MSHDSGPTAPSAVGQNWTLREYHAARGALGLLIIESVLLGGGAAYSTTALIRALLSGNQGGVVIAVVALCFDAAVWAWFTRDYRKAILHRRHVEPWPWLRAQLDLLVEELREQEVRDLRGDLHWEDVARRVRVRDSVTREVLGAVWKLRSRRHPDEELVKLAEYAVTSGVERMRQYPPDIFEARGLLHPKSRREQPPRWLTRRLRGFSRAAG